MAKIGWKLTQPREFSCDKVLMHRYRPPDNRTLAKEAFEKKARNNDYLKQIYHYPEWIIPHPTPATFQKIWQEKCATPTTVHVEIGCGSGGYLLALSQCFPEHRFLGLELRYKRLVLAAKKLKKFACHNVLLLQDKGEYLDEYFGEQSIDKIYVNFPDPWPKKAHRKKRLLTPDFFQKIALLLRPHGEFLCKTDHQEYFESVTELLNGRSQFQIVEHTRNLHQSDYQATNIETEFEKMFKFKTNPQIGYMKVRLED